MSYDFDQPPTITDMGNGRVWPGTSQISGFGGGYEDHCRKMLRSGLAWLDAHPDCDLRFTEYEGIFGLVTGANDDAKALSKAIEAAGENDFTGAMHHAVVSACLFIRRNGWEKYCAAMTERDAAESSGKAGGAVTRDT